MHRRDTPEKALVHDDVLQRDEKEWTKTLSNARRTKPPAKPETRAAKTRGGTQKHDEKVENRRRIIGLAARHPGG